MSSYTYSRKFCYFFSIKEAEKTAEATSDYVRRKPPKKTEPDMPTTVGILDI